MISRTSIFTKGENEKSFFALRIFRGASYIELTDPSLVLNGDDG